MVREPHEWVGKQVLHIFKERGFQILVKLHGESLTFSTEKWDILNEPEKTWLSKHKPKHWCQELLKTGYGI